MFVVLKRYVHLIFSIYLQLSTKVVLTKDYYIVCLKWVIILLIMLHLPHTSCASCSLMPGVQTISFNIFKLG